MEDPNHKWRFLAGKIIYTRAMASMAMLNNLRVEIPGTPHDLNTLPIWTGSHHWSPKMPRAHTCSPFSLLLVDFVGGVTPHHPQPRMKWWQIVRPCSTNIRPRHIEEIYIYICIHVRRFYIRACIRVYMQTCIYYDMYIVDRFNSIDRWMDRWIEWQKRQTCPAEVLPPFLWLRPWPILRKCPWPMWQRLWASGLVAPTAGWRLRPGKKHGHYLVQMVIVYLFIPIYAIYVYL